VSPVVSLPRVRAHSVFDLAAHGERVALRTHEGELSYADLAARAADVAETLGGTRRLVLIECANTLDTLITLLAALQHGHVALLVPPGRDHVDLMARYDPDVVAGERLGRWRLTARRAGTAHQLHPDLALLLSTSGSTGSPKLVRLSYDNLRANAAAIADYLDLTPADRAITALPLHYCYGLSVVTSHLSAGAAVTLTELSVVDDCFWQLAAESGVTNLAGVPYTFELLEQAGRQDLHALAPTLRLVTQAGGRLAPELVRAWAQRGRRQGWDLVVMYGQTEATARMAFLPAALATTRPESIGVAIPGGTLRLDPAAGQSDGVGELVYAGPNVMLGYAESASDLAEGASLTELRTGDLARERDGLFEIVGRLGRHAKLFGVRLDLARIERACDPGVVCVAGEHLLHVFGERNQIAARADELRSRAAHAAGLPPTAVRVTAVDSLPRTSSGKPDLAGLGTQARDLEERRPTADPADAGDLLEALVADFALVLGRDDATPASTFVSLGGDSLSYVELATRLGDRLGELPTGWHLTPIQELATQQAANTRSRVDTSVVLRALGILAIVGSHANLFMIMGGAHVLLAVAGFNLARFQLGATARTTRLRHGLASLARLVVPSTLWIGGVALLTGFYTWPTAFFLNGLLGSDLWTDQWQFWFLESIVWATLGVLALLSIPALHRLERRRPFEFALGILAVTLAMRYLWVGIIAGSPARYALPAVAWFIALGWAAARADSRNRRLLVSVLGVGGLIGFFGFDLEDFARIALIAGAVLLLIWRATVPVPRSLVKPLSVVASASLFIYLTHWQVYPHLEDDFPLLATIASVLVGIAYYRVIRPLLRFTP
jgi:acyl-CoA synthetase (AMP-forming)/AMP-acid ligase II